jgi:hypothetical protein
MACVQAAKSDPGNNCAVPRTEALHDDPAMTVAQQKGLPTIDLTRYFCDAHACFPVIGGVLVHKDATHVTPTFARTLGPYLLTQVRRIAQ